SEPSPAGAELAIPSRSWSGLSCARFHGAAADAAPAGPGIEPSPIAVKGLQRAAARAGRRACGVTVPVLLCCAALPGAAAAQDAEPACAEGRISSVFVDNHSVFDLSDPDLNMRFAWAYRLANGLHAATRESVIRRELLFEPGDCYQVELLRDS